MYSVVMLEDFYPYESDFRLQEKQNRLWVPASFTKRAMKSNANNKRGKGKINTSVGSYIPFECSVYQMIPIYSARGEKQWIAVQAGISTLWFNIGWLPGNLDVPLRIKKKQTKNWYMFLRRNRKRELQCWNLMTLKCHCSYPYKYTLSGYFIRSPVCALINANI